MNSRMSATPRAVLCGFTFLRQGLKLIGAWKHA